MKKIIVALLTVLLVFAFCGCESENISNNETNLDNVHMTKCYDDEIIRIYRHEETGVYYLGGDNDRAGWCVMVNADGTPYTGE